MTRPQDFVNFRLEYMVSCYSCLFYCAYYCLCLCLCVCEGVRASMHQTSHYTRIIVKAKGQFVSMGCMDQTQIYRLVRKMMFLAESSSCPLFLFGFGFVSLCRCFRQLLLLLCMLFIRVLFFIVYWLLIHLFTLFTLRYLSLWSWTESPVNFLALLF